MKLRLLIQALICASLVLFNPAPALAESNHFWLVQSIDTMKHSRDAARENRASEVIRLELKAIKNAGATHVAIGTPYDEEFIPVISKWVTEARKVGLNVWFRGNFSGWEGWFDYPKDLTREEHLTKTYTFITQNPNLFESGDAFTPCPECENGGPGDPRITGDSAGYRQFVIDTYQNTNQAFDQIDKSVYTNWFSMNGDIARDIMDKPTYQAIGNLATIDHYVATAEEFESDLIYFHNTYDVNVLLGEFGAPIPDIHGDIDQDKQAKIVEEFLEVMFRHRSFVKGMNYWTYSQSSTALADSNFNHRQVYDSLKYYWQPASIVGTITNLQLDPLSASIFKDSTYITTADAEGNYRILAFPGQHAVTFSHPGYISQTMSILTKSNQATIENIALKPIEVSLFDKLKQLLSQLFS